MTGMVEGSDIRDEESLKAWLKGQPREVAVWIAFRAAARVLPVWWDAVLTEDWAHEHDVTALPVLHALHISSITAHLLHDAILGASASKASAAADFAGETPEAQPAHAASHAAYAAGQHTNQAAYATFAVVFAARACANARFAEVWNAVRADAGSIICHEFPKFRPLWPEGRGPLAKQWDKIKARVGEGPKPEDWQFWIDSYGALLNGRPMLGDAARTREMLEKIALIDPATWDKGPEAVNPVIREIWELHRLRAEVAGLQAEKAAFLAARASAAQRAHNQPPGGLVDDAPEVARQITIIWDGLDEAREELEQDAPDKGRLRVIAEQMLAALNAVVAYCGKVADAAVMSAAKVGGGAVGTAVLDHVALNGRLMQFAKDLLAFGGGG